MVLFESLSDVAVAEADAVGSKAKALASLAMHGFKVPAALCIPTAWYDAYMSATRLRDRVIFELGRKRFEDMRWEEIWDAALRIRNLFVVTPLPADLHAGLHAAVVRRFADTPVVVRSSAPGEDSAESSFAGLHESFVNVRGPDAIIKHVRLVWASLWSDAALLYRQELGLDVRRSRMAVIVQSLIDGECSGVAFSRDPGVPQQAVIEAVYGLNAGLVDGTIEPDRWTVDRRLGRIAAHAEPRREHAMAVAPSGIVQVSLDTLRAARAPLSENGVAAVFELALAAESRFGAPQDVEWTRSSGILHVLQSRPITTLAPAGGDDTRAWYRSLSRSFENLKMLRRRIEDQIVPEMQREADDLAGIDPTTLSDEALIAEEEKRRILYRKWRDVYWDDCIPFAHGVRLFGQYYNDVTRPDNPYEFMDLLSGTAMLSLARNRDLEALAQMLRDDGVLREAVQRADRDAWPKPFADAVRRFVDQHGDVPASAGSDVSTPFLGFLIELARAPVRGADAGRDRAERLQHAFFEAVGEAGRAHAEQMLDLARASHRWRDDDNVYLDAVEAQWRRARDEAQRRRLIRPDQVSDNDGAPASGDGVGGMAVNPRQLIGQPAGPGVATGMARLVNGPETLLDFKRGEILVCDALSPTMTFVIPLAGAIVERRGGMLIHGAIIAREYGIPCVTGVPDAATLIHTGMRLTVDGYLGIVRVHADGDPNT